MKKKGFTLIELIAVLVILAILALIVTPLVMNIIRKARISADKRSIDAYGRSVELAIATYLLDTGTFPTDLKNLNVEYTGKTVSCNIMQMKENGGIYLSECTVNGKRVLDDTEDGYYHYGTRDLTNEEYVVMYGKALEKALKDYYDINNTYPSDYRMLTLDYSGKSVTGEITVNYDGTIYMINPKVSGISVDTTYGVDKSTGVKAILSKINPLTITYYEDGNKNEMYTFEQEATSQTPALTDYRYIGNTPNNYVEFNNELWRIIGVFTVDDGSGNFEQRIKILRNNKMMIEGGYCDGYCNEFSSSDFPGNNYWVESKINTYLNNTFYNSLSSDYKQMVSSSSYYLGNISNFENINVNEYYSLERNNISYNSRTLKWIGKIGLIYPSDYLYSYYYNVENRCSENGSKCNEYEKEKSWMYWCFQNQDSWTITPTNDHSEYIVEIAYNGRIKVYSTYRGSTGGVVPTLYLSSQVKITSGDGSEQNPYKLSM